MMTKARRVFNYFAVAGMFCAISILSACGSGEVSNSNSSNSTASTNNAASTNNSASPAASSPSPAAAMEKFTADTLIEALKKDRSEVDTRLKGEEISISGVIKIPDTGNITFLGKDGSVVNCSEGSPRYDKDVLQNINNLNYQASSKHGSPPIVTAIGTYHLSNPKPNGTLYVGVNGCRIEGVGK